MKILITGMGGFVARHFMELLSGLDDTFEVTGIYNERPPEFSENEFKNISCRNLRVNMVDKTALHNVLRSFRPEYILHLASKSSVAYSWLHPEKSILENTVIFLNLLEVIREENIRCRILTVGSAEEYGYVNSAKSPLKEDYCLMPVNPYGVSRVLQHNLVKIYSKNYNLDIFHTFSFNHLGPYQSEDFVIASFAKQIAVQQRMNKKDILLKVGDVEVTRDFTDVRDVVKAYFDLLLKGRNGDSYNVCSNKGYVLKDVINMYAELTGLNITYEVEQNIVRPYENKKLVGCNEKISKEIGWKPEIPIEKSLKDLLEHWQLKINI